MLKRGGAILLTMLYVVTVFGFALNLHYCFGALSSVKIDEPAKNCKMVLTKKPACCKDKEINVKVKDAHQAETPSFLAGLSAVIIPKVPFADHTLLVQETAIAKLSGRGPPYPPTSKVSYIIKHCTFLI